METTGSTTGSSSGDASNPPNTLMDNFLDDMDPTFWNELAGLDPSNLFVAGDLDPSMILFGDDATSAALAAEQVAAEQAAAEQAAAEQVAAERAAATALRFAAASADSSNWEIEPATFQGGHAVTAVFRGMVRHVLQFPCQVSNTGSVVHGVVGNRGGNYAFFVPELNLATRTVSIHGIFGKPSETDVITFQPRRCKSQHIYLRGTPVWVDGYVCGGWAVFCCVEDTQITETLAFRSVHWIRGDLVAGKGHLRTDLPHTTHLIGLVKLGAETKFSLGLDVGFQTDTASTTFTIYLNVDTAPVDSVTVKREA